ncbi:MAG: hypothetical protein AAFN09_17340, partial [Pseudomonadota bacterium]
QSRVAQRIIRARGDVPTAQQMGEVTAGDGDNTPTYLAALVTEGFPQMGFSLFCTNGKRHAFLYHNIDNLELTEGKFGHYITLAHRGKVVTIRGQHMHEMFQAIMEHTLQALYQFDPAVHPEPPEGEPMINFIRVQSINPKPQRSDEDEVSGDLKFEEG